MSIIDGLKKLSQEDSDVLRAPTLEQNQLTWPALSIMFIGMWFSMWAVVIGFTIGTMLPAGQAIVACFLGFLSTGIYMFLVGAIGAKTKLSTAYIVERGAGKIGAGFFALSVVIIYSWAVGMQADVAGRTLANAVGAQNPSIFSGILAIIMVSTGIIGIKAIKKLSWIAVPVFLITMIVIALIGISKSGGIAAALSNTVEAKISFGLAFTMATGAWISFATMAPDVTRFAKTPKNVLISSLLSFVIGSVLPIIGVFLATTMRTAEIGEVFKLFGLQWLGFIVVFAAAWTTNDNNTYCGGLALAKLTKMDRRIATMIIALVGVVLAFLGAGATDIIGKSLGWLVSVAGPAGGIMIGEYYLLSKYGTKKVKTSGIPGFIALLCATILSLLSEGGLKPIILVPNFIVGIISGMVLLYVFVKIEQRLINSDTEEIVA